MQHESYSCCCMLAHQEASFSFLRCYIMHLYALYGVALYCIRFLKLLLSRRVPRYNLPRYKYGRLVYHVFILKNLHYSKKLKLSFRHVSWAGRCEPNSAEVTGVYKRKTSELSMFKCKQLVLISNGTHPLRAIRIRNNSAHSS